MVITKRKNIPLPGLHGRPIPTDVFYSQDGKHKPILLFCHGYKGFKDWGAWNIMAEEFARRGFLFIKFNFAFNGGTLSDPVDFPDLDAFGRNTYTRELDDLHVLLDWICSEEFPFMEFADLSRMALMGHSRGGGVAVVKASEDERVKKIITLAAVSDFGARFPKGDELESWRQKGIAYVENSRTKQKMPHFFDFYEDFKRNEERLTISRSAEKIRIPALVIHGTEDPTVSVDNAYDLHRWIPASEIFLLKGSDHVFGISHPWEKNMLSPAMELVVSKIAEFSSRG